MKNRIILGTIIIVLLISGISLLNSFLPAGKTKPTGEQAVYSPYIAIRGEEYLDMTRRGAKVGDKVSELNLLSADGTYFNPLVQRQKSLIVFGTPGNEDLKFYAPLLKEWARIYKELPIFVVFRTQPSEGEIADLNSVGAKAIVNFEQVRKQLDPGRSSQSFLLDEKGSIVYKFKFEVYKWREFTQIIDQFARKSTIPQVKGEKPIKIGTPLQLPEVLDATGKNFNLQDFKDKPTVLYLVNPFSDACKLSFPLIHRLWQAYDGIANIVVIFSYYDFYADQDVRDYYNRYGFAKDSYKSEHVVNPKKMVAEHGLEEITTFFDRNRTIFNFSNFWVTPTIVILDKDLRLVEVMGITTGPDADPQILNEQIEKVLLDLF